MSTEVGVIVGRFQTPTLHDGHRALIHHVQRHHQRVLVFVGQSPLKNTANDPLDFITRRAMIEDAYETIEVHRIDDVFNPKRWSAELDRQIATLLSVGETAVLYGSRRSFLSNYCGNNKTVEVPETGTYSSTEIRHAEGGIRLPYSEEWRRGVVHGAQNRYPTIYTTVDIAAVDLDTHRVLLGKKPNDSLWRFPGGFSDVISSSFEEDAKRELIEETNLVATDVEYVGSKIIDDPRYRNQKDKIKTLFFVATKVEGVAKAGDDLAQIDWQSINIPEDQMVPNHRILLRMLRDWYKKSVDI